MKRDLKKWHIEKCKKGCPMWHVYRPKAAGRESFINGEVAINYVNDRLSRPRSSRFADFKSDWIAINGTAAKLSSLRFVKPGGSNGVNNSVQDD